MTKDCYVNPADCRERFDNIDNKLDVMNSRLFIGNGTPSFATRIDRLEQSRKGLNVWLGHALYVVIAVFLMVLGKEIEKRYNEKELQKTIQTGPHKVNNTLGEIR